MYTVSACGLTLSGIQDCQLIYRFASGELNEIEITYYHAIGKSEKTIKGEYNTIEKGLVRKYEKAEDISEKKQITDNMLRFDQRILGSKRELSYEGYDVIIIHYVIKCTDVEMNRIGFVHMLTYTYELKEKVSESIVDSDL